MTAYAAREAIAHGILTAVPIDHPIASSAQCHLLRNSDRRFSPAAHHMWRLLHNAFATRSGRWRPELIRSLRIGLAQSSSAADA